MNRYFLASMLKRFATTLATLVLGLATSVILLTRRAPIWVVLIALGVLALIWAATLVLKRRHAVKNAQSLEKDVVLKGSEADRVAPANRARIAENKQRLDKVLAILRNSAEGTKALYTLPWYMVAGPIGCGKTTAIKNSGLKFPTLSPGERLEGSGPTQGCFWWINPEGIILDTAGRYTDVAESPESRAEWEALLGSVKRYRKKCPINGLILGVSMEDLIKHDEIWARGEANRLRKFMDDIVERLGWVFPVYVLFTKSDLIAGFKEFFSYLEPIKREQAWGAAFAIQPPRNQEAGARFGVAFDDILMRLRDVRVRRMSAVEAGQDWGRVFMFPEELSALREKLCIFMDALFEPNLFMPDAPRFRGAYFSSGKQMDSPFEVVVQRIRSALGVATTAPLIEQVNQEETFFVHDLFARELKRDRDLARRTKSQHDRFMRLVRTGCGVLLGVSLLLSILLPLQQVRLFRHVRTTYGHAKDVAEAQRPLTMDALLKLGLLSKDLSGAWTRGGRLNWAVGVKDEAEHIGAREARDLVLRPSATALGQRLAASRHAWEVRPLLRAHLFLASRDARAKLDWQQIAPVLMEFVEAPIDTTKALASLNAIVKDFKDRDENVGEIRGTGIDNAVRILNAVRDLNSYYSDMVHEDRMFGAESLQTLATGAISLASQSVIRGAFTKRGWDGFVRHEIGEVKSVLDDDEKILEWVGAELQPRSSSLTSDNLLDRYTRDYPGIWGKFFDSIEVRGVHDCESGAAVFADLTGPQSPIRRVLEVAAERSNLSDPKSLGGLDISGIAAGMNSLSRFTRGEKDKPIPVSTYLEQLGQVQAALTSCEKNSMTFTSAEQWVDRTCPRDAPLAGLNTFLRKPIQAARAAILSGEVMTHWRQDVIPFFDQHLANKYPFSNSGEECVPSDAVEFFRPGGILDSFRTGWLQNPSEPVRKRFQDCLDRAREIQGLVSGNEFRVTWEMEVQRVEPSNNDVDIVQFRPSGGDLQAYLSPYHSGTNRKRLTWVSGSGTSELAIIRHGRNPETRVGQGPWSFFRLVDLAEQGGQFVWNFDGGIRVVTTVQSGRFPFPRNSKFRTFGQSMPRAGN